MLERGPGRDRSVFRVEFTRVTIGGADLAKYRALARRNGTRGCCSRVWALDISRIRLPTRLSGEVLSKYREGRVAAGVERARPSQQLGEAPEDEAYSHAYGQQSYRPSRGPRVDPGLSGHSHHMHRQWLREPDHRNTDDHRRDGHSLHRKPGDDVLLEQRTRNLSVDTGSTYCRRTPASLGGSSEVHAARLRGVDPAMYRAQARRNGTRGSCSCVWALDISTIRLATRPSGGDHSISRDGSRGVPETSAAGRHVEEPRLARAAHEPAERGECQRDDDGGRDHEEQQDLPIA